jgi:RHS repeat-associated protein
MRNAFKNLCCSKSAAYCCELKKIVAGMLMTISLGAYAQQVEVITTAEEKSAYQGRSYLVVKSLTLKPGFVFNGSQGAFFAKIHPDAVEPDAPSPNKNFVKTETIFKEGVTTEEQVRNTVAVTDKGVGITYSDGLGRNLQSLAIKTSPSLKDLVQPAYYDELGRPSRSYLPYIAGTSTGAFQPQTFADQAAFYNNPANKITGDSRPYGEAIFDNSPLNRIKQTRAVGADWANKPVSNNIEIYEFDGGLGPDPEPGTTAVPIRIWDVVNGLPQSTQNYTTGTLIINQTSNEQGMTVRTYSDFLGRTVLDEVLLGGNECARTYYVRNLYGELLFIIPPMASENLNPDQAFADRWYFQYEYDEQQRPVGVKSPGAGWVYTIYDRWERPVLTQDANQRAKSPAEGSFVKYDEFNRPVISGIFKTNDSRSALVNTVAASNGRFETRNESGTGYTLNQTFPASVTEADLLSVTYFDNYSYLSNAGWDPQNNSYSFVAETGFTGTDFNSVKDLPTGSKVRMLNDDTWLCSVSYYDNRYRPLQIISKHHMGGTDRLTTEYDFSGQVLKTLRVHASGANPAVSLAERYEYDHAGRLLRVHHRVNNQPEVVFAAYEYNELGQVVKKKIHSKDNGSSWLQALDTRYNIRGWLTGINTTADSGDPVDYFGMELGYNNSLGTGNGDRYDGLISGLKWKNGVSNRERAYNYNYNNRGELTGGAYKTVNGLNPQTNVYTEDNIIYDYNGNIKTLRRNSGLVTATTVDNLSYNYGADGGNQLMRVSDSTNDPAGFSDGNTMGDDYEYDANGNLVKDLNKGISSIQYNVLDLPEQVNFSNGYYIVYGYDASGIKLFQEYYDNSSERIFKIDYAGEFIYLTENSQTELQTILHGQGRLVPPSFSNLIANTATREANSLEGYTANQDVTLTSEYLNGETYVKMESNQSTSTPGVWPIGGTIAVKKDERYSFKILGYRETSHNAQLYVWGNNGDIIWTGALLPQGQANETWVISEFTIPPGVTQIKVGVLWDNPAVGATFYINRVALYKLDWEYQYFITDHLGSPRVVLQTEPHTFTYTATMESENFDKESQQFLNLNSTYEIVFGAANATPGGNEALKMNANYRVGPSRSFKVFPGDVVDASVMAYYSPGTYSKTSLATMAAYVISALTGGGTQIADGITYSYNNSGGNPAFALSPDQGSTKPSAFLNYILFDETFTPLEAKSAPLGGTAGVLHPVVLPTINIEEPGILFVYLSYDNDTGGDVFFDDLKITYQESPVIQITDYYPYGLPSFVWLREGEAENKYQFQGKELDEKTGWYDFHARQYDPATGRWFAMDPKGQFTSPYLFGFNNPVMTVDPDGELAWFVPVIIGAVAGGYSGYKIGEAKGASGWNMFGYIAGGAIIGGVSGYLGGTIAASGGAFSNTLAIAYSSTFNSMGMNALSGGMTPVVTSFGGFSYDWTNNDWGYLGERGNRGIQNIGYAFGALANLQDVVAAFNKPIIDEHGNKIRPDSEIDVHAKFEATGHSSISNRSGSISVSVGPDGGLPYKEGSWLKEESSWLWNAMTKNVRGKQFGNFYDYQKGWHFKFNNVNSNLLEKFTKHIDKGKGLFGIGSLRYGMGFGCVQHTSRALWAVGIPTLPVNIHPLLLNTQLLIRQMGIYASPYLITNRY